MRRALLSVTDKTGLVEFAKSLVDSGFQLVSTGGTAKTLRDHGLEVMDVSSVTGFPEMLDGRIKTLHPKIHGGLLADVRLQDHKTQIEKADIQPFEIVCVNLYAFERTVLGEHSFEEAIESIDIGGPAMIRAGAKNHANVTVVVDPGDYDLVIDGIRYNNLASLNHSLAAKAFRHTAFYDSMVSRYLTEKAGALEPEWLTIGYRKTISLRYGENPHQKAALYQDPLALPGIAQAKQLFGKELSYNNILDGDAAWELVCDLPPVSCAIIKHGNPSGVASSANFGTSYEMARSCDPISAFGGIAAFNGVIDKSAAEAMTAKGNFLEVVIGTKFSEEALLIFRERSGWGQDVRLIKCSLSPEVSNLSIRSIRGGALVQTTDEEPESNWKVVTAREPSASEMESLKFAWKITPHVKSNAIVIAKDQLLLGVGAGQMNRVQSVRLAIEQAGSNAVGAGLASDAFFPFPDSIETAHAAGITAIIQPGGSKKDADVIEAANNFGMSMILTGIRHFRH